MKQKQQRISFLYCTCFGFLLSTVLSVEVPTFPQQQSSSASSSSCNNNNNNPLLLMQQQRQSTTFIEQCPHEILWLRNAIYILYDVNPPEGFNLRRDVYIRLAVFIRKLKRKPFFTNIRLVLPPWNRLYHWKSTHLQQENLPWSHFFDIESLRRYAPVLDFPEFLEEVAKFGFQETPYVPVHQVFQLRNFEEMFQNGVFYDKFEFMTNNNCRKEDYLHGYLLKQPMLLDNDFNCVRFQGSATMLERVILYSMERNDLTHQQLKNEAKIYAFLNAEIVLHENWGDREFWRARRSMRFAVPLVAIADHFRRDYFNSTIEKERVQRPIMWELEKPKRSAIGGDYLCAHMRRGDFVVGRETTTPTLRSVATQIRMELKRLNLTHVYLATDATAFEIKNLRSHLTHHVRLFRYTTDSLQQKHQIKDGGIAIIDQIICSSARHFIGTYESTFTYRIYEEREILGFSRESTFNTFCKSETKENCLKNSKWPIVY